MTSHECEACDRGELHTGEMCPFCRGWGQIPAPKDAMRRLAGTKPTLAREVKPLPPLLGWYEVPLSDGSTYHTSHREGEIQADWVLNEGVFTPVTQGEVYASF